LKKATGRPLAVVLFHPEFVADAKADEEEENGA